MAQKFRSIFTADVSQYQTQMQAMRRSTAAVAGEIRGSFAALAGLGLAGYGAKELVGEVVRLGAAMQQTRIAFEVMMGSAAAADKVLGELTHFADVTPFDNAEVIQSGRLLLNAGISVEQLSAKLTELGDIAAGSQTPIEEMAAIYAKAATKGRVQAMELNQLAAKGVPILQALAKTLGRSTEEVLQLSAQGRISFALLDEALSEMAAKGGRYFGLMERQSDSLAGRWSVLEATLRNTGMAIGEEALPAMAAAVGEFQAALDEMAASGELAEVVSEAARSLASLAQTVKTMALWLIEHQKQVKAIAKGALWVGLAVKTRAVLVALAGGLQGLAAAQAAHAVAAGASAAAETAVAGAATAAEAAVTGAAAAETAAGAAAAEATPAVAGFAAAMSAAATAALGLAAVLATAFIGFKLGEVLGELMQLDNVLAKIILKLRGLSDAEIDGGGSDKIAPSVAGVDLADAEKQREEALAKLQKLREMKLPQESEEELQVGSPELQSQLAELEGRLEAASRAAGMSLEELGRTDAEMRELLRQREALEARLAKRSSSAEQERLGEEIAGIDQRVAAYHDAAQREIGALELTELEMREAWNKLQKLRGEQKAAGSRAVKRAYQPDIEQASKEYEELRKKLIAQRGTKEAYDKAQDAAESARTARALEAGEKVSAAEKFRAEERARLEQEVSDGLAKLTKSETEQKKAEWAKQVAAYREAYAKAGIKDPEQLGQLDRLEEAGYAKIDEERRKSRQALHDHLARLTLDETERQKRELRKQIEEYRKAGATLRELASLRSAALAKIEEDRQKRVLTAQRRFEAARQRVAEERGQTRLDAMMQALDRQAARLQAQLERFRFDPGQDWRRLEGDAGARRKRRRETILDEGIDDKMGRLERGERVRFSSAEKARIAQREKLEKRLRDNEKKGQRGQDKVEEDQRKARRRELRRELAEAGRELAKEGGARQGARRTLAEAVRPQRVQGGGKALGQAAAAAEAGRDYSSQLAQMAQLLKAMSGRVFVVKGA